MDNIRHVRGRVVRKQQCVVGGELGDIGSIFIQLNIKYSACLEDVARGEAGEDEASHQLRVGDNHTVSADKVKVLTHDVWSACRSFKHWRVTESLAVKCQNQNVRSTELENVHICLLENHNDPKLLRPVLFM